jgi:hypothetical protein
MHQLPVVQIAIYQSLACGKSPYQVLSVHVQLPLLVYHALDDAHRSGVCKHLLIPPVLHATKHPPADTQSVHNSVDTHINPEGGGSAAAEGDQPSTPITTTNVGPPTPSLGFCPPSRQDLPPPPPGLGTLRKSGALCCFSAKSRLVISTSLRPSSWMYLWTHQQTRVCVWGGEGLWMMDGWVGRKQTR